MFRSFLRGLVSQWQQNWKLFLLLYTPIALLFVTVGILSRTVNNVSLAFFLRDIVATGKLPFFAGFVAQLAAILWSSCLAICCFALWILPHKGDRFASARRLLLYGGMLTGVLLLDDVFLFHEEIAPLYLHISERIVIGMYLLLGIAFVVSNWKEILQSEYLILTFALAMFGASIFMDALPIEGFHVRYFWKQLEIFLEDGFKFAGIATWLTYYARYAKSYIERTGRTTAS